MTGVLALLFDEDSLGIARRTPGGGLEWFPIGGDVRQSLIFLVAEDQVRNDEYAHQRALAGDASAIPDFYRAIEDPERTVTRYGATFPVVSCLDAILQRIQEHWIELGATSGAPISTVSVFNPSITAGARSHIRRHLDRVGFPVVTEVDWHECLLAALQGAGRVGPSTSLVVASSAFGSLRYESIDWQGKVAGRQVSELPGYGEEPRVFILADLMVRGVARKSGSPLYNDDGALKQEIQSFHGLARQELGNFEHGELRVRLTLSDHHSGTVTIDERDINQQVGPKYKYLRDELKKFISKHSNLTRTAHVVLAAASLDTTECRAEFTQEFGAAKLVGVSTELPALLLRGLQLRMPDLVDATPRQVNSAGKEIAGPGASKPPALPGVPTGEAIAPPPLPAGVPRTSGGPPPLPGAPLRTAGTASPLPVAPPRAPGAPPPVPGSASRPAGGAPPLPAGPSRGSGGPPPLPGAGARPTSGPPPLPGAPARAAERSRPPVPPLPGAKKGRTASEGTPATGSSSGPAAPRTSGTSGASKPPLPPLPGKTANQKK